MVELIVPQNAVAGSTVKPVLKFGSEWAGRTVKIVARWAPGTGYDSYNTLVNGGGNLLVSRTVTVGGTGAVVPLGSYTQPANDSTVGVFINGVFAYAKVGSGSNPIGGPMWELDYRRSDNIQIYVNNTDVKLKEPDLWPSNKMDVMARIYFIGQTFKGHIEVSALGYTCHSPVTTTNASPVTLRCSMIVPPVQVGEYPVTLKLIDDFTGKTVATRTFQVKVHGEYVNPQPQPKPTPNPNPTPTPQPNPNPQPGNGTNVNVVTNGGSKVGPLVLIGGILAAALVAKSWGG